MKKNGGNRGVYAGSFDPVTYGHLDIAFQAACMMNKLYMVVGVNPTKKPLFTAEERIQMINNDIATHITPRLKRQGFECDIEVVAHAGLTASFMKANNAPFHIRGLRVGMEFDTEYPALLASSKEYKKFTPVFLCTVDPELQYVSSSMARGLAIFGAKSTRDYVTPATLERLTERIAEKTPSPGK